MASISCLNDESFGPAVRGCRDDFDFTQKFERILFSIVPSSIFILLAATRLLHLAHKPRLVLATLFQFVKVLTIAIYVACQLSLLLLVATVDAAALLGISVAALALICTAGVFMIALSFLEHARSLRTSALLNLYLLLTLIFDVVQARTLWLAIYSHPQAIFTRLFTASIGIKLIIIFFEAHSKARWIDWDGSEHSPEEISGIYSLSVYYWLKGLFLRGYKRVIRPDDLYSLDRALNAETTASKLMEKLSEQRQTRTKHSLPKALFSAFSWPYLLPVLPQLAFIAFQYSQSFFLQALIGFLNQPEDELSKSKGYGLIGACALIYLGMTLSTSYFGYYRERAASMTRACLCAAIYKKTTEITTATASDTASVTLMSSDVESVEIGIRLVHFVWSGLVQVGVGSWLLYTQLGAAFAAPVVIISICFGVFFWVMMLVQSRQSAWMEKIQNRVGCTTHAVSNMKYFKMLGISDRVADSIQDLRREEIHAGNKFRLVLLATFGLSYIPLTASPVVTFALLSRNLETSTLFVALSFITLLTSPLAQLFQGLPQCLAAFISLRRIEAYLAQVPRVDLRSRNLVGSSKDSFADGSVLATSENKLGENNHVTRTITSSYQGMALPSDSESVFLIKKGSFGWDDRKMVLKELDIAFPRGKMTMIVGPIASGKSTLCRVLLGEVPIARGSIQVGAPLSPVGYCAQTPFLLDKPLKENVTNYSQFDQVKYDAIITATMLSADVALLPYGDRTKIGSNGIVLSGGQKQRVALARALYLEQGVLILDDVFSGLDATTETEIFKRVFGPGGITRRRRATTIICTHSVRHLPSADHIIVLGTDGRVVEQGSFDWLSSNGKYISNLGVMSATSDVDDGDAGEDSSNVPGPRMSPTRIDQVDTSRQSGDWSVYLHYLRNIATRSVVAFVAFCVVSGTANNFSTVWVSYWSEDTFDRSPSFYVGIYGFIGAIELLSILIVAYVGLIDIVASSGANLHRQAITTVVRAPLSLFTTTDTGTVINLFSQDMTLIDGELPLGLLNTFIYVVILAGNLFVAAVASPYLAIAYPFLLLFLYALQVFYLRTSRQLRLLDLEAKSPLYNHFIDTMRGLATIRAFGWVREEIKENNKILNSSQQPAYLLSMIQAWLQTNLTILVGILATCLTALATQLRTSSSFTGASLLTLMNLVTTIATAMRSYTALETSIGAVNRLRTFSQQVKPEDSNDENRPVPDEWPAQGHLTLNAVSASYKPEAVDTTEKPASATSPGLALNNISMSIKPGEKIAICGRTGSGKSSLMLLLLRLLDPLPGSKNVVIDDIPVHHVDRSTLRQRIITIPQDSVFLPGKSSIKLNLDPLGLATDHECISVLETVQLSEFVRECGGLYTQMNIHSLSEGQQQLFGLGRAVLRRVVREKDGGPVGGILLIDEMNSKLDKDTDKLTQEIVAREFSSYTVIMVAHRLDMVMNMCHRVFVLDKGALVEEGSPRTLAATERSRFAELWNESTS